MNTSGEQINPKFLCIHPKHYADEPTMGKIELNDPHYRPVPDKLGSRFLLKEQIKRLMQELQKERKRSARWKKVAIKFYAISQAWIGD